MTTIVHVYASDWEGVYVNGLFDTEGHSLTSYDWKRILKRGWNEWHEYDIYDKDEWLDKEGSFPIALWELYEKAGLSE